MSDIDGKACPFCGCQITRVEHVARDQTIVTHVECNRCCAHGPWANGPDKSDNETRARKLWDIRTGDG